MIKESIHMAKKQNNNGEPKFKRKQYEKELRRLQAELCHLQDWVKSKGLRIIVVFEGRDSGCRNSVVRHYRYFKERPGGSISDSTRPMGGNHSRRLLQSRI